MHDPNSREYNNNGMSGLAAIAMALCGDKEAATFFSRQVANGYGTLESGHGSYLFNVLWTPLVANVAGPEVKVEEIKNNPERLTNFTSGRFGRTWKKILDQIEKGEAPTPKLISFDEALIQGKP